MNPSIKELRKLTKKSYWSPTQQFWHNVGVYFTWIFARTPITPNQVTALWVLMQCVGPLLFINGNYSYMIIGVIIYHLGLLVDCADGQLARYKKQYSVMGIYLDHIGHHISISILLVSLSVGVFKMTGEGVYIAFGALGLFSFVFSKLFTLNIPDYAKSQMREIEKKISPKTRNKLTSSVFSLIRIEHPLNILFWLILFGKAGWALMLYSVLFFLEMGRKLVTVLGSLNRIDNDPKLKLRKNI
jgi:hypothetical protein